MVIEQRNRVSYTTLTDTGSSDAHSAGTFYTYDILGNVDLLLQDYGTSGNTPNVMNKRGNGFKKIRYQYDLINGPGRTEYYYQYRDFAYDGGTNNTSSPTI